MKSDTSLSALAPAFDEPRAIVLAGEVNYAAPMGVALTSLVYNSSELHTYDLVVLWPDEGGQAEKARLAQTVAGRENFSLRFVNMRSVWAELESIGPEDLYSGHHYLLGPPAYYRLFIPAVLKKYSRALYLDSDLIVMGDVAELMSADLKGQVLGAARDHWAVRVLREPYGHFLGWRETLELKEPDNYFNSGVLVMDLTGWRDRGLGQSCIERLKAVKTPRYHDQDILNHVCQDQLTHLDPAWNSLAWWGQAHGDPKIEETLPEDFKAEYQAASLDPRIIHYLNNRKPWLSPWNKLPLAAAFHHYAGKSPFADELKRTDR